MKAPLVLTLVALAGSVNAQFADPAPYADGFPVQPPSDPPAAAMPVDNAPPPAFAPTDLPVPDAQSYPYFYQPLQPYGEWVTLAGYGPCWRPANVPAEWRPYLEGRWVWTDGGWSWASNEPWGWATYHYGRWMPTAQFGWVWVPGRTWAPAWVNWRSNDDVIGWAPMPPDMAVSVAFGDGGFSLGLDGWTMVRCGDFLAPRCASVAFSREACRGWLPRTATVAGIGRDHRGLANVGAGYRRIDTVAGHGASAPHFRDATVPSRGPATGVERHPSAVNRPVAPAHVPASDINRVTRPAPAPATRTITRPQAPVSAPATVTSHSSGRRPPAAVQPSMPARTSAPSPAPASSRNFSRPTPQPSHASPAPVVRNAAPVVHQPAAPSGGRSAPASAPSRPSPRDNRSPSPR